MLPRLSFADFFSGAGGFSEGFRRAGFRAPAAAIRFYAHERQQLNNQAAEFHVADVKAVIEDKEKGIISVPDIQVALILFSPPCQGFSSANSGGGNDEENRGLFSSVGDIARSFRPYWILIENVPGLILPSNRVYAYKLVGDLLSNGYGEVHWRVQCASNFGVPQTRRRVILFAALAGLTLPDFPDPKHASDPPIHLPLLDLRAAIGDLNHDNPRSDNDRRNPRYNAPGDAGTEIHHHATDYCRKYKQKWGKADWDDFSNTVRTSPGDRWDCVYPDEKSMFKIWFGVSTVTHRREAAVDAAWTDSLRTRILKDYPALEATFREAAATTQSAIWILRDTNVVQKNRSTAGRRYGW
ncbi:S-adenosyl-L-methionine-dependent methyltransferase [Mycena epipterygia]|nr:S-adenosyl-L-methionine-dependent methyltransferase [Mycena epipterygia]